MLKILVMGDMMLIPKYFIPLFFQIKRVPFKSDLNVWELSAIASLLFKLILYPEKLPNKLTRLRTAGMEAIVVRPQGPLQKRLPINLRRLSTLHQRKGRGTYKHH